MSGRGRICLHAPYLYPLFSDGAVPFAGGAETQQAAIARGLAQSGFDVSAVTCDYGQPREVVKDGVRLIRSFPPHEGLPVLRFFHPRLTRTIRALRQADADAYYVRGAGLTAGVTFDVARSKRAGFVFAAAHDHDTRKDSPLLPSTRDRWWYRRALLGADRVLAQTRTQQHAFLQNFNLGTEHVPNLVEVPVRAVDVGRGRTILWLSTYKTAKRPEWFVQLARMFPQYRFVMRGVIPPAPLRRDVWEETSQAAATCPNLAVGDHVEHQQLSKLYEDVALFVHTSPAEGFANTLLESWSFGVPTLACADPDDLVRDHGFGEVGATIEDLGAALGQWMEAPDRRREAGMRARTYVIREHGADVVMERLGSVLDRVIGLARQRR